MIDDLGGARLAELFIAEVVGRELGRLGGLVVSGIDHPARFTCAIGERYEVVRDGELLAQLAVEETGIVIELIDGPSIRIEDGMTVKTGLDELLRRQY